MANSTKNSWSPQSWRQKPAAQQPPFEDQNALDRVIDEIKAYPPLVFVGEVDALRSELDRVTKGESFLLQGGDCAERFKDCNEESISRKLKILLQMSVILCYGLKRPVVRVGRIAGQYSKPRSNNFETLADGQKIPVFRGDNVNTFAADPKGRVPDPHRLLKGLNRSALTLNYIRALTTGGFADLHHPDKWDLGFMAHEGCKEKYDDILANIKDAVIFMQSLGSRTSNLKQVDFYTSHEGLILPYEEAQTYYVPSKDRYYNLGAHMLWIGERTRGLDGAHIEYFKGIANPIGLKVGPNIDTKEIHDLLKVLNPLKEPGKLVLITRLGQTNVQSKLPNIVKAVKETQVPVVWSCDPMHGNAITVQDSIKTRDFNAILSELRGTLGVHQDLGTHLGGVHFELTGENVTECIGGSEGITEHDLGKNYESYCDPRLNYSQSLEIAFMISDMMQNTQSLARS